MLKELNVCPFHHLNLFALYSEIQEHPAIGELQYYTGITRSSSNSQITDHHTPNKIAIGEVPIIFRVSNKKAIYIFFLKLQSILHVTGMLLARYSAFGSLPSCISSPLDEPRRKGTTPRWVRCHSNLARHSQILVIIKKGISWKRCQNFAYLWILNYWYSDGCKNYILVVSIQLILMAASQTFNTWDEQHIYQLTKRKKNTKKSSFWKQK
jgi:hypothetical protein